MKSTVLDEQACYAALKAHDTRFDGRFFVGVSSTGIYCRPICRVKIPKAENCSYYVSAASAESAGFRPCLKCRPELAPGNSLMDSVEQIARKAALAIEEGNLTDGSLSGLADALGITDRHLRRAFAAEYGVSPVQYLQTCKLLLAKSLLTDTDLPVTEVAMSSGFGSIRRFNDLFKTRYKLAPQNLRKFSAQHQSENQEGITLFLGYRPPYEWKTFLSFLADRAISGVENVAEGSYRRTVTVQSGNKTYRGWISVINVAQRNSLAVTLAPALLPVLSKVLSKLRLFFDVNCNPQEIFEKLATMNDLAEGMCVSGTRLPGSLDSFEIAVRAILGQQITVKAARTLAVRFTATFGESIDTPFQEVARTFPAPETICGLASSVEDQLGALGITRARARSISSLAQALTQGHVRLSPHVVNPVGEMEKLLKIPGFGPWTVQYLAMRALAWPDAFPHTDHGVKKALHGLSDAKILSLSEAWRPWRSYATVALWNSLGA
ncbi:MAG: helix-turn-helix domain-containing protein [Desulfovibrio sp.]|jgi:AraC family transcriptional regulator of adaptative response / DNA-3-methyladenine glycosylase II|nr:helix-turn-helix domain-containing protein [Desulfovibrio sp.]